MNALIDLFSLGRLADLLARAVGWSPVGHRLELVAAEGAGDGSTEPLIVQVLAIQGDDLVVEPESRQGGHVRWRLSARHRGWSLRSLFVVAVAVTVKGDSRDDAPAPFALAVARRRT